MLLMQNLIKLDTDKKNKTVISKEGEERSLQWLPSAASTHLGEVGACLYYPPCFTRQEVVTERD